MTVGYLGPMLDHTGYGEANRHDIAALQSVGIEVSGKLVRYTHNIPDYGTMAEVVNKAVTNTLPYTIKILHTTPDQFRRYVEPGVYTIGRFFWETSRVPQEFVEGLNLCDEIWTGSQANVDAMVQSGVTKPIFIIPQAIETNRPEVAPYVIKTMGGKTLPDDTFIFYSIFEWTERKNPKALVRAYWDEFGPDEKVALVLKTYFKDFTFTNKRKVEAELNELKREAGGVRLPSLYWCKELLDRSQIQRLHTTGQCLVSAHRGEGWGLPLVESLLVGNPIISTNYGGVNEYLTHPIDGMLLGYTMVPVQGMDHSPKWYTDQQEWADINPSHLREYMRWMFTNQSSAQNMGMIGRANIKQSFNFERVGGLMKERLEKILL